MKKAQLKAENQLLKLKVSLLELSLCLNKLRDNSDKMLKKNGDFYVLDKEKFKPFAKNEYTTHIVIYRHDKDIRLDYKLCKCLNEALEFTDEVDSLAIVDIETKDLTWVSNVFKSKEIKKEVDAFLNKIGFND